MKEITREEAQQIVQQIEDQKVVIEFGYGGVLFLKIGEIKKQRLINPNGDRQTYLFATTEFYSNEDWQVFKNSELFLDRWETTEPEYSQKTRALKHSVVKLIEISDNSLTIRLEDNYELKIFRRKSLTTWSLDLLTAGLTLRALGNGTFEVGDCVKPRQYKEPAPQEVSTKQKQRRLDSDPVFQKLYQDDAPISVKHARAFIHPMIGSRVHDVTADSGESFNISLNNGEWLISVDDNWQLIKKTSMILNSTDDAFHFKDQLYKSLKGKQLTAFEFDHQLDETNLLFDREHLVKIIRTQALRGEITTWTVFNRKKSFHINLSREGALTHTIVVPDRLKELYAYSTKGSAYADNAYALDLYREYVSEEWG